MDLKDGRSLFGVSTIQQSKLKGHAKCAAKTIKKWNKHEVQMDSSKRGPENGGHKYKGVKHTPSGNWAAQIWDRRSKSRMYVGTYRSELEAALAYDEAALQIYGSDAKLNFPNYSLSDDHDEDCPTVISISTSDSSNCGISGAPFVNTKRKARTPVVNRGDGRRMSRFIKKVEPKSKKEAVGKALRESSIQSLLNTDIQMLCTVEKMAYLGSQGAQTGLHDGNIDQKDEASISVSSQSIECGRKRERTTVSQRRGPKCNAETRRKLKECNRKRDSKGSQKGCVNGKGCQRKDTNAGCIYRGVRKKRNGKWGADIWLRGTDTRLWLGTFRSEMEAALAYDEEARKVYGSSAQLNFPDINSSEDFDKDSPSCMIISASDSTSSSMAEDPRTNILRKARTREDGEGMSRVDEIEGRLQGSSTLQIVEEEVGKTSGESLLYTDMEKLCTDEKPDCEGAETESCRDDHICLWGEMYNIDELIGEEEDFDKDSPSCIIITASDSTSSSIAEEPLTNILPKVRTPEDGEGVSLIDERQGRLQGSSTLQIVEEEVGKTSGEPLLDTDMEKLCTDEKPDDCEVAETESCKGDHICLWGEMYNIDELIGALDSTLADLDRANGSGIGRDSLNTKLLMEMEQTTSDGFDFWRPGQDNVGSS